MIDELIQTDVLVLGSGITGATAALRLAQAGAEVVLATRAELAADTNTDWAQGGIVYRGAGDTAAQLAADIQHAGAGHCNPKAVQILAEEGPDLVRGVLIDQLGVPFDRNSAGDLALALEGGHSLPRIAHTTDATGHAIQSALLAAISSQPAIRLLSAHTAIDLLTPAHHARNRLAVYDPQSCLGAYLLDREAGQVKRVIARRTILATGGLGQIFLYTSNPFGSRGDGLAMAYRAGARVINAEFIQFHPTTFYDRNAPRFLISEAVRGEGARLVHADGQPFMQRYDPEWKDLAPRDVVARSIHQEMLSTGLPNVYLDLRSYIPAERIRSHFPNIVRACQAYGIDPSRDLVPVAPAAHYFCGGVWVDEWGQTTIDRLYAAGEVSCTGLHGANRLASTSLLEGLVWGWRAAQHILDHLPDDLPASPDNVPPWEDAGMGLPDPALITQDFSVIQHTMWNYVGLVRTTNRLDRALRELRFLETEIERFYRVSRVTDGLIGLRNAVRSAVIVAAAAWENKTSLGCHYRE
jgi:L-aspartate oxidase